MKNNVIETSLISTSNIALIIFSVLFTFLF